MKQTFYFQISFFPYTSHPNSANSFVLEGETRKKMKEKSSFVALIVFRTGLQHDFDCVDNMCAISVEDKHTCPAKAAFSIRVSSHLTVRNSVDPENETPQTVRQNLNT